ncbi:hypothetical protein CMT22_17740 [Elizabethkingia anophelis]|nr:hypothetical protein [Elizabethkingia anophelis]
MELRQRGEWNYGVLYKKWASGITEINIKGEWNYGINSVLLWTIINIHLYALKKASGITVKMKKGEWNYGKNEKRRVELR